MNTKRFSALLLATGFSFVTHVQALDFNTKGFMEDSHLDIGLKNIWMLNTTNAFEEDGVGPQSAWAQAMQLDYQSGLYRDRFGIGASWYGVSKLYANRSFAGRDLVRDNYGHAEGFNKIGQLYARSRFGDTAHFVEMKAGWHQLYKFGILNVTRSRAAPSSWQGISSEARYQQLYGRAAVVNRFSERDEPEKRHFRTLKTNKKIDYIATGDLTWQPQKGRAVTLVGGESKDYLLREGVESAWFFPLSPEKKLLLRGVYYYNKGLSGWEGSKGFSHSARHLYGLVGIATERVESGLAWSKTRARLKDNLGRFYWHLGKNTRGAFNSKADGPGNDYVNDGEQMYHWYGQYQLTPTLLGGIYGYYGNHLRYQSVALKEWEYGGFISWSPEWVPGLTMFSGFGPSYGWKLSHGKPALNAARDGYQHAHGIGGTVSLEYKHRLL